MLPVFALLALCALATGGGQWNGAWPDTAMAGGASPKAAPMQAEGAGTAVRTGVPATPEVRGAVAGTAPELAGTAPEVAGSVSDVTGPERAVQSGRVVADMPHGQAAPPEVADSARQAGDGRGTTTTAGNAGGGDASPEVNGADEAAADTAKADTANADTPPVGLPDAPLVAQAEQAERAGQAGQAGQGGQGGQARPSGQSAQSAQSGQSVQSGQPAEPRQGASSASRGIRLFNTIEFRGPLKNLPKWDRVLNVDRKTPGLIPERALGGRNALWGELRSEWRGLSTMDKLRNVNSLFNQWPYRLDSEVWGVVDYWAAPVEFLRKSGDCEDYAITKYFALKQLGVSVSDMRIVILLDSIRRLAHAILVVYTGGDAYVLDNLSNVVLSHQRYGHYVPQYSINEEHRWAHIPIKGGPGTRRMQ
ncbi:transglutaminase-like cysteine peptidase [Nitratidesulfovibrio sp.]|uniref:transglutaminase-like cysteine peptidase n=1 Tax=Nitratidesulfovibrio sp. TaxID=2802297 RepID=UPI003340AF8D